MGKIEEYLKVISEALQAIGNVIYVITHPIIIWNWFMGIAYWIAVLICCVSIIYYATSRSHKASQVIWLTIIIYCVLKGVDMVI
ncbi:MAG TPA: hypothetical protein VD757_02665 [Candidatus Nitrosocosmicus sp.]|nr:hypothetical protein [Candidatus Nitrosocosmicus sp.]